MLWFKHRSDARNSLKLRKVRRKYGSDGYAIYWFCLEAIAYDIDKDNLTFQLKEDAETIAFELSIQEKRVSEIMIYMVDIGLFESSESIITCLKLAESIDKSMTNSPKMRKWLDTKSVMTCADDVKTCAELDKNRSRKEIEYIETIVQPTAKPRINKFTSFDMENAKWMFSLIKTINPNNKDPNFNSWAEDIRKMREIDKREITEIQRVFTWANKDQFWCSNILSPSKLRTKFDDLVIKSKSSAQTNRVNIDTTNKVYTSGAF